MKKRPSSACRSRTTPSTTRPTSASPASSTRKRDESPSRSIRFSDQPSSSSSPTQQRNPTFVTSNKNLTSTALPNLENSNTSRRSMLNSGNEPRGPQTDNKSAHMLRGLVSAETGFNRTSILETLICSYLRYGNGLVRLTS
mgnify:CR=1 FL=1